MSGTTGKLARPGSAVQTGRFSQSSPSVARPGCGGGGPKRLASPIPSQGSAGWGAVNRRGPTGGGGKGKARGTNNPLFQRPPTFPGDGVPSDTPSRLIASPSERPVVKTCGQ